MSIPMQKLSCQHFEVCAGCRIDPFLFPPPIWQEVLHHFTPQLTPLLYRGPAMGWRCRAKLAVRGSSDKPLIGLFKSDSHDVVPIPHCLVHYPQINEAIEHIKNWIRYYQLSPYREDTGVGDLRYLQCVVERLTGKVQVTFVLNYKDLSAAEAKKWQSLLLQMVQESPEWLWHSVWINFNDKATNTIFGEKWSRVWGEELLWEKFGETLVCYQPANFAQANLDLFELLLLRIRAWIPPQAKVTEFYAGVGVIGLFIAPKCAWVRCEEVNPHAEHCFLLSKERLSPDIASRLSFHTGAAETCLSLMQGADVVIVDPPRKGLSEVLLKSLIGSQVKQLIYVSCGWESFKKDSQRLISEGWSLKKLEGYAFFLGSNHVELLACFER